MHLCLMALVWIQPYCIHQFLKPSGYTTSIPVAHHDDLSIAGSPDYWLLASPPQDRYALMSYGLGLD